MFILQKIASIEKFQANLKTILKGCLLPIDAQIVNDFKEEDEDKVVGYINENQIHLAKVKEKKRILQAELEGVSKVVQCHLEDIAKMYKWNLIILFHMY